MATNMKMFGNGKYNSVRFRVSPMDPVMICPVKETPKEVLYLSNIDDQPCLRATIEIAHVYGGCGGLNSSDPATVIREAVSRTLVYYYPLAGRLSKTHNGKLEVNCNGEGGVFVEANANCTLGEVGHQPQNTPCMKQLLPEYPRTLYEHHDIPPLVIQVTRFLCGGFVVAFGVSQCTMDGLGFSQFVKAIAELARGMPAPTVIPEWKRDILAPRNPPQVQFHHLEFADIPCTTTFNHSDSLIQGSFVIVSQAIRKLKKDVLAVTKEEAQYCSTFEALAAFIWKSRVKALKFPPNQQVQFHFIVNVREMFNPPLPQTYCGNSIFSACISVSVKELSELSLWDVVKLMREKKASLTDEYLRSGIDFLEFHREELQDQGPPSVNHLYLTDWTKMEYSKVDFGWGEAMNVSPLNFEFVHVGVLLPPPLGNEKAKDGVRFMTCLHAETMERFISEMQKLYINGRSML